MHVLNPSRPDNPKMDSTVGTRRRREKTDFAMTSSCDSFNIEDLSGIVLDPTKKDHCNRISVLLNVIDNIFISDQILALKYSFTSFKRSTPPLEATNKSSSLPRFVPSIVSEIRRHNDPRETPFPPSEFCALFRSGCKRRSKGREHSR